MRYPISDQPSNATTGYIILAAVATMLYSLAFKDLTYMVFAIPLIIAFILAASIGKRGGADEDLEAIGWTNTNSAVPLGIGAGLLSLFLGSLIVGRMGTGSLASLVPDLTTTSKLFTASVVPPFLAVAANVFGQWAIVAPSEEALTKILGPYAAMSIFKNTVVAFLVAILIWMLLHVPTFMLQSTPNSMYIVLFVIGIIGIVIFFVSGSIMASIIQHGVFNSAVILISQGSDAITVYLLGVIAIILFYAWRSSK